MTKKDGLGSFIWERESVCVMCVFSWCRTGIVFHIMMWQNGCCFFSLGLIVLFKCTCARAEVDVSELEMDQCLAVWYTWESFVPDFPWGTSTHRVSSLPSRHCYCNPLWVWNFLLAHLCHPLFSGVSFCFILNFELLGLQVGHVKSLNIITITLWFF